jgi:hypothetical protein
MQHILDATRTRTGFRTPRRDIMWHLSDITSNVLEDIIYECAVWCKQDDDDIMMMATHSLLQQVLCIQLRAVEKAVEE